ncbi:10706_t:CDS:2 [Gigaspora rosea]|nr:10706_t:CDS:2 [Gigaspora rosea]
MKKNKVYLTTKKRCILQRRKGVSRQRKGVSRRKKNITRTNIKHNHAENKYKKPHSEVLQASPTFQNLRYNIASTEANTSQLSPYREKFFTNIEFTQEMCERVEFYTNVIKLRPLQIQKAIQKEFPDYEIYLSEIYKVTKKFYIEK